MMPEYQETRCRCFWEYLTPFTRFWGLFTAVVLCGVGFDFTYHHYATGIYIVVTAVIVFLLELTWTVTLFLHVCLRSEYSPVYKYWDVVLWLDGWKKSILYAAFSIILFIRPHRLWLCTAAGVMLIVLAVLYIFITCKKRMSSKDQLLGHRDESFDSRFDDVPEVLDDTIPVPIDSLSENLADLEM